MLTPVLLMAASLFVHTTTNAISAHRDVGDYLSPDGKYIAHVAYETGSTDMNIYCASSNHKRVPHSRPVMKDVICVDGIAWVPGQAHTLVFATSSVYGVGALGQWHKGSGFQQLVKVRHPNAENFQLQTISRDGRTINYLHGLYENQDEDTYLHRTLNLPKP